MNALLDYWEKQWLSWQKTPRKFCKGLQDLHKPLLGTDVPVEKLAFVDHAPLHLIGNWTVTEGKIFIGSLNPGASEQEEFHKWESDKRGYDWPENKRHEITWKQQVNFCLHFFRNLSTLPFTHSFFRKASKVINGIYQLASNDQEQLYILLHKKLVFGELIPFYSSNFQLHRKADLTTLDEFWKRVNGFLNDSHFKTFLLNGKGTYNRFLNRGIASVRDEKPVKVRLPNSTSKVKIVKIKDLHGVLSPHLGRVNYDDDLKLISYQLKVAMSLNGEEP